MTQDDEIIDLTAHPDLHEQILHRVKAETHFLQRERACEGCGKMIPDNHNGVCLNCAR